MSFYLFSFIIIYMPLTLISWNINGIRAVLKKGFLEFLKKYQPDIIALQEIKIAEKDRFNAKLNFPNYTEIWHSAERPGYSGTAILIREKSNLTIINHWNGFGKFSTPDQSALNKDPEGRIQTIEFEKFFLINAYFPNTRHDLSRLDFKIKFNNKIFAYVKKLEKKKPVIITGDFNVAHREIDLANPKENEKSAGFTIEERTSFDKFLKKDMIDTFRELNPKKIQYTWWTYRFGARRRNIGWRIDYFIVSKILKKKIIKAEILDQVMGSDHCPIKLKIDL